VWSHSKPRGEHGHPRGDTTSSAGLPIWQWKWRLKLKLSPPSGQLSEPNDVIVTSVQKIAKYDRSLVCDRPVYCRTRFAIRRRALFHSNLIFASVLFTINTNQHANIQSHTIKMLLVFLHVKMAQQVASRKMRLLETGHLQHIPAYPLTNTARPMHFPISLSLVQFYLHDPRI
jgi:hypothetical protein